jgi:hypothetical protein
VLIEDKASGTQLIQELIADGRHGVTRYPPTGDKTMRLHAQTGEIILFCAGEPDRSEVRPTLRWRETDSNSRSLREGKGYGQPLQQALPFRT